MIWSSSRWDNWNNTIVIITILQHLQDGYFEGYDQFTNPSASNVFVSAAFRLVKRNTEYIYNRLLF